MLEGRYLFHTFFVVSVHYIYILVSVTHQFKSLAWLVHKCVKKKANQNKNSTPD
jgi:hypothetical protein